MRLTPKPSSFARNWRLPAGPPFTVMKDPPAYRLVPSVASAATVPVALAVQPLSAVPAPVVGTFAMRVWVAPLTSVKLPPTNRFVPVRASELTALLPTSGFHIESTGAPVAVLIRARRLRPTGGLPTEVNWPPT